MEILLQDTLYFGVIYPENLHSTNCAPVFTEPGRSLQD